MAAITLTYFDFAGSRGEEVRLALTIAGLDFTDNRIGRDAFAAMRKDVQFAGLPVLEIEGKGTFSQSNAILRMIGRISGLYPEDLYRAARHDAFMEAAEELRQRISATMRMTDADRKAARHQIAADYLPQWATCVERLLGSGPFVEGERIGVADLKLYIIDKWISSGGLDDVPAGIFDGYSRLKALTRAVASHPAVLGWYARKH